MHAHIDKGHAIPRVEQSRRLVRRRASRAPTDDRARYWGAERCRAPHGFRAALRLCAWRGRDPHAYRFARGAAETKLGRVPRRCATRWAGRIALQAVSLSRSTRCAAPMARGLPISSRLRAACSAGSRAPRAACMLVCSTISTRCSTRLFRLAAERGLDLDLHVDEFGRSRGCGLAARRRSAILRNKFKGSVVCGHCCSPRAAARGRRCARRWRSAPRPASRS